MHIYNLLNVCIGGCAGVCGVILGQPLDLIKTRMQTSTKMYTSAYSCFLDIVQNGGYQSFYKGMTAPLCSQFFQSGLMFTGENIAMSYLEPNINLNDNINGSTRAAHSFLSGSFGGLLKCVVLVPADLIKCKLQVDTAKKYTGSFDCFSKVFKNQGINGLYTGFTASAMREIPSFGVFFLVYRHSLNTLNSLTKKYGTIINNNSATIGAGLNTFIAGGIAGSVSWTCIYPFDVIKSNIQVTKHSLNNQRNVYETALHLYSKYGLQVFTRGLGVTIFRAFPVNATMLYIHESLKILMFP
jgi:solute carrier family 25 carnitine/acylcarnitine transporter 20/29